MHASVKGLLWCLGLTAWMLDLLWCASAMVKKRVLTRKIHFGTHTYDLVSDVGNPFWGITLLKTLRVL